MQEKDFHKLLGSGAFCLFVVLWVFFMRHFPSISLLQNFVFKDKQPTGTHHSGALTSQSNCRTTFCLLATFKVLHFNIFYFPNGVSSPRPAHYQKPECTSTRQNFTQKSYNSIYCQGDAAACGHSRNSQSRHYPGSRIQNRPKFRSIQITVRFAGITGG